MRKRKKVWETFYKHIYCQYANNMLARMQYIINAKDANTIVMIFSA